MEFSLSLYPSCPNVEKASVFSLVLLSGSLLLITFSILVNFNSAVILNTVVSSPRVLNVKWAVYFGFQGIIFFLEFYSISDTVIDFLKKSNSWILCHALLNELAVRSLVFSPQSEESLGLEQSNLEEGQALLSPQEQDVGQRVHIIAVVALILSVTSVLFQKFQLDKLSFLFGVIQEIPIFISFALLSRSNGPSISSKRYLLLGLVLGAVSWVPTRVLRNNLESYGCIVPPYWWGDQLTGYII